MKNDGFALFIILAVVVILTSCASPGGGGNTPPPPPAPETEKGTIKLEADTVGASQAWVEMEDESGNLVFSDSVNIVDKSFSITLPVGKYTILKYILVDSSGTKLSVVPIKGKKLAKTIPADSCLPFEIEVTKGTSTPKQPKAVPYNGTPGDFGFSEDDLKKPVPPTTGGGSSSGGSSSGSSSDRFKTSPFAPTIRDITITPETINDSGDVVITLTTDSVKKPVSLGMIKVYSPDYLSGDTSGVVLDHYLQPKHGAEAGVWEAVIRVNKFYEKGEWVIASVMVADEQGKASFYEYKDTSTTHLVNRASKKASSLAIPKFTASGNKGDTTPPTLTGVQSSQATVSIPGSVTFSVSFADGARGSGVDHASIVVSNSNSSNSDSTMGSLGLPLQLVDREQGLWQATIDFEDGDSAGTWMLTEIYVKDKIGNNTKYEYNETKSTEYYYNEHTETVISAVKIVSVDVSGGSTNESAAPKLKKITVITEPTPGGLINKEGVVIVEVEPITVKKPLHHGMVEIISPDFENGDDSGVILKAPIEYNTLEKKWQARFPITKYHENGKWIVEAIMLADEDNTERFYLYEKDVSTTHLIDDIPYKPTHFALPYFNITGNTSTADITAPELRGIEASTDVVIKPGTVKFTVDLFEEAGGSGIETAYMLVSNRDYSGGGDSMTYQLDLNSDTGLWETEFWFNNNCINGKWRVSEINIVDGVGNRAGYIYDEKESLETFFNDFTYEITTIQIPVITLLGDAGDTTPPVINSISQSTASVTGAGSVTFTLNITDTGTGVNGGTIYLKSPAELGQSPVMSVPLLSDSAGWIAHVPFSATDEAGEWTVIKIEIKDNNGNSSTYISTDPSSPDYLVIKETGGVTTLPVPKVLKK